MEFFDKQFTSRVVRVFDLGIEYGPKLLERFECNPVKVHVVQIPKKDLR